MPLSPSCPVSVTAAQLLEELEAAGATVRLDGDRLRIHAPVGRISGVLRRRVEDAHDEVVALLADRPSAAWYLRASAPLSFEQEGLWLVSRLNPQGAAYNTMGAIDIRGELDVDRLRAALDVTIARHDVLRATFHERGGIPCQRIHPPFPFPLERIEVAAGAASRQDRQEQCLTAARRFCGKPFSLDDAPPIRGALVKVDDDWHLMALAAHHIVSDGWSIRLLFEDIAGAYDQNLRVPESGGEVPLPYGAYAAWQRRRLQGDRLEDEVAHWRDVLRDLPLTLLLPPDRPLPVEPTGGAGCIPVRIEAELATAVQRFGAAQRATTFVVLLAAFQEVLARFCRQDRLVVGSPVTRRVRKELERTVGLFATTLVLPGDVSGAPSFADLVTRTRDTAIRALAHADLPFELLVRELRPPRPPGRNPIFQAMFTLQSDNLVLRRAGGVELSLIDFSAEDQRFDVALCLRKDGDAIAGSVHYAADFLGEALMARFAECYLQLITEALARPEVPVRSLPILSGADEAQLAAWNTTSLERRPERTMADLFERQVAIGPARPAVRVGGTVLSYADLDREAERLAGRLRARGVGAGDLVGICCQRSAGMVVAMLAAWKAGAAYVGTEPGDGSQRREAQLRRLGVGLVIADETTASCLPDGVECLPLDGSAGAGGGPAEATGGPAGPAGGDGRGPARPGDRSAGHGQLAYVISTSGSTGAPKAIGIEHANAISFISWAEVYFEPCQLAVSLATTSPAFDCALFEIWAPLCLGGSVVIAESVLHVDQYRQHGVTLVSGVPTALAELLGGATAPAPPATDDPMARPALPASVDTVVLFGESLPAGLVWDIYQRTPARRVYNFYGPSEATTFATGWLVNRAWAQPSSAAACVPIGVPIGNTRVHVLDDHGNLLPIGVPGELCLAGAGVACGYLGDAQLTAQRFVPDPLGGPGARMYRSRDLGRWRDDGLLEFLGRLDREVKVRGYRVDPAEVEQALRAHPGVRDAAVVARGSGMEARLLAYLIAGGPPSASGAPLPDRTCVPDPELRRHLAERLPLYMLPSAFVTVEALPRTASGKLDASRLPDPDQREQPDEVWRVADPLQVRIEVLWCQLLGQDRLSIPVDVSFFEVGGHSLLALMLLSRVREIFGVDIPLGMFFANPTIEALADEVRQGQGAGGGVNRSSFLRIGGRGVGRPFFCAHPGGAEVHLLGALETHLEGRDLFAVVPVGRNDDAPALMSIPEMAERHLGELSAFQDRGPFLIGGFSVAGLVAFELARRLDERGQEVGAVMLFETRAPQPDDGAAGTPRLTVEEILKHEGLIYMDSVAPSLKSMREALGEHPAYDLDGVCGLVEAMKPGLAGMLGELRQRGLVVTDLEVEDFHRHLDIWAKYLWAAKTYRPAPFPGTVTVYQSNTTAGTGLVDGWRQLATRVESETVDVSHGLLLTSKELGLSVARRLSVVDPPGAPGTG